MIDFGYVVLGYRYANAGRSREATGPMPETGRTD